MKFITLKKSFQRTGWTYIIPIFYLSFIMFQCSAPLKTSMPGPQGLKIKAHDNRIDLRWKPENSSRINGYNIYRSSDVDGPFIKLNGKAHYTHVYSDFFGENNKKYYYYVSTLYSGARESGPSDTLSAASFAMSDEELLTSVQEATFRYFFDYGHPVSGLARERNSHGDTCTSGGTGMGLLSLIIGAERGFESRDTIAAAVLDILSFMQDKAQRYHGAWAHWISGKTGRTIPFSKIDDGADLVETAYFVQGLLTVRNYFTDDNDVETEIRKRAAQMWEELDWEWFRRKNDTDGKKLFWHWSPNYGWEKNLPIIGFHEAMIVYLLAIASPTHPVPASLYYDGWADNPDYANGKEFYGYKQWVGMDRGGPLFFTHYTFLTIDPRLSTDKFCNYFNNNRNISLINRAYCIENPQYHKGYSSLVWGLTASDDPWGYSGHAPTEERDNGTITPAAAIGAMPYIPEESIATLKHFYHEYGTRLWGEFGFKDAFNLNENWFADGYLAIDQGPIIVMIENYRTQLCWNLFMANEEIQQMLNKIGWKITDKNTIQAGSK